MFTPKMYKMLRFSVLCFLSFVSSSSAVTSAFHNRQTSFDELKSIDGLVSSGLPLFSNGFFIDTASGPVLVKSKDENSLKKPLLNPGYYSTLPRVIPAGLEGIAISHFNLGTAIPAQGNIYEQAQTRTGQVQYYTETNAPQSYEQAVEQQQQQQYFREIQPQVEENPTQQRLQRFLAPQNPISLRYFAQQNPSPQRFSPQEMQQRFLSQQSQQRHRFAHPQQSRQTHLAQETFQLDNFLTPGNMPTSYQNQKQEFGPPPLSSRTLTRNPTVEQALALEDDLPEALRNPFYKNEQLASALAQESLPVEGEQVVGEWDTTKIQKIKIMELLRGAGFI